MVALSPFFVVGFTVFAVGAIFETVPAFLSDTDMVEFSGKGSAEELFISSMLALILVGGISSDPRFLGNFTFISGLIGAALYLIVLAPPLHLFSKI